MELNEINKYINDNFNMTENYKEAILNLDKITNYLIENKIDINLYLNLINNKIIYNCLDTIFKNNINIQNGKYLDNLVNDIEIYWMDLYCILNDIKICNVDSKFYNRFKVKKNIVEYTDDSTNAYIQEISSYPVLSEMDEKLLILRSKNNDLLASDILVERNLRLVVAISKNYVTNEIDLLDLVQEGTMGLICAIKNFDFNKSHKFSTYSTYWIKRFIFNYIRIKTNPIRIPSFMLDKIQLYKKTKVILRNKLKREPSNEEIANYLNITLEEVKNIKNIKYKIVSSDNYLEDENHDYEDLYISSDYSLVEEVNRNEMKKDVVKLFEQCGLTDKEKEVLALHFGIGCDVHPLEEIGKKFNLSRERIRQIEGAAIIKMRRNSNTKNLAIYLGDEKKLINNLATFNKNYNNRNRNNIYAKEEAKEGKKVINPDLKSIYQYLNLFPKDLIDFAISNLNLEELKILRLRYGEDLEKPVTSASWNKEHSKIFYNRIVPKIKRIVKEIYNDEYKRKQML